MIPGSANPLLMKPAADDAEVVTKSCRFDGGSLLKYDVTTTGDRRTFTIATWVKLTTLGTDRTIFNSDKLPNAPSFRLQFTTDNKLDIHWGDGGTSAYGSLQTLAVYRDTASFAHVCLTYDTTETTNTDRIKLYWNGVEQGLEGVTRGMDYDGYYPSLNTQYDVNLSGSDHVVGSYGNNASYSEYGNFYLADFYFIDGAAVTPKDNFTNNPANDANGQLKPKEYTSSLGSNGFHLDFEVAPGTSNGAGTDAAGSNHLTESGLSPHDQMEDRPTNNYAVLNPLDKNSSITLSEGSLKSATATSSSPVVRSTVAMTSNTHYAEFYVVSGNYHMIGIANAKATLSGYLGSDSYAWSYYSTGLTYNNATTANSGFNSYTTGDVIGVLFDATSGNLSFYKNGSLEGQAYTGITQATYGPIFFAHSDGSSTDASTIIANFGADPTFAGAKSSPNNAEFFYALPTGAEALSTANLADPDIKKGADYFDTELYTSNGTAAASGGKVISGMGFQPALVWIKNRDSAVDHKLFDAVRGVGLELESSTADAEYDHTSGTNEALVSFNSDGFKLGNYAEVNNSSSHKYASWNWLAGTGFDPAGGSATTDGSKNSTAGFSIAKWTGNSTAYYGTSGHRSLAHGLSATPDFALLKSRSTQNWIVYHKELASNKYLILDENYAQYTHSGDLIVESGWDADDFKVGNESGVNLNYSGINYVAYLWNEVAGYSKFGKYTGNSNVDGPFIWCGFRPAFVLIKIATGGYADEHWILLDSVRDSYNTRGLELFPHSNSTEYSGSMSTRYYDFLSNGFKIRTSNRYPNYSGATAIWAAFAESPFKYASAR